MKHQSSYTIWFSQRTGSTLLGTVLEKTSIAGKPREWFNFPPDLLSSYRKTSHAELQEYLFNLGSTSNGVLGINHSYYEPHFTQLIETLRKFPACPPDTTSRTEVWEHIFPNHRHIFMSHRNKIRLAVSWWRAIQSGEWHVQTGGQRKPVDLSNAYSFDAINHLYNECSMREAGIQELFTEGNIIPMNLYYEDFVQDYEKTIRTVLDYLELDSKSVDIPLPAFIKTADSVSEEWVQLFREERQNGWTNRGW